MLRVKLCGFKRLDEAQAALQAGADLLGFNFYPPSPRAITPDACRALLQALRLDLQRSGARTVGVFVNLPAGEVARLLEYCGLDLAQLHGDEPPADLQALGERAYKAVRLPAQGGAAAGALEQAERWMEAGLQAAARRGGPALLLDALAPGLYGGAGQTTDWQAAVRLAQRGPLLLAGGLHAGNLAQAAALVRPWGVDAASGVESRPGVKDPARMAAFTAAARSGMDGGKNL